MLYYNPQEYGLVTVATYDAFEPGYDFDMLVVWRETATGKLWAATDSGCSCPTPFEDHTWPTDFTEVRSWQDVKELLDTAFPRDGSRRRLDHSNLRRTVQRALAGEVPDDPPQREACQVALSGTESPPNALSDPGATLQAGDALQSAASRMAEYILSAEDGDWLTHDAPVPYEVTMAALEAQSAVEAWTEARTDTLGRM